MSQNYFSFFNGKTFSPEQAYSSGANNEQLSDIYSNLFIYPSFSYPAGIRIDRNPNKIIGAQIAYFGNMNKLNNNFVTVKVLISDHFRQLAKIAHGIVKCLHFPNSITTLLSPFILNYSDISGFHWIEMGQPIFTDALHVIGLRIETIKKNTVIGQVEIDYLVVSIGLLNKHGYPTFDVFAAIIK